MANQIKGKISQIIGPVIDVVFNEVEELPKIYDALEIIKHNGETVADLPIKELGDEAPVYNRPFKETPKRPALKAASVKPPMPIVDALDKLIGSPELCSKRWVWEQYDHVILGNTVQRPGGDAAVVRVLDGPKALALTVDVTPRYCEADPFEGGKQAVAEAWRNITAVGGKPLAITDNLNFGNPEKPEIMGQFVGCVRGIAEACKALDFPVVSGNVSLYNETNGVAIPPTPTVGAVGLLPNYDVVTGFSTMAEGDALAARFQRVERFAIPVASAQASACAPQVRSSALNSHRAQAATATFSSPKNRPVRIRPRCGTSSSGNATNLTSG